MLITGAARGVGRSCALRFASAGADLVLVDRCADDSTAGYALATDDDLERTNAEVISAGVRAQAHRVDVRDQAGLDAVVKSTLDEFGRIDVVVPNAGISSFGRVWELSETQWQTALDVMLSGAWRTVKAAIPAMIEGGRGGAIVLVGSAVGTKASTGAAHYVSAKHGLVGLTRALALELADYSIRANLVAPGSVGTAMALNETIRRRYRPDLSDPTVADVEELMRDRHALPVPWVEATDVANAVAWLASEQSRYITGAVLPVDAGWVLK